MVACYDIIKTAYTHHTCKSNCGTVRLPHQIIFKKHMVTEIRKVFAHLSGQFVDVKVAR